MTAITLYTDDRAEALTLDLPGAKRAEGAKAHRVLLGAMKALGLSTKRAYGPIETRDLDGLGRTVRSTAHCEPPGCIAPLLVPLVEALDRAGFVVTHTGVFGGPSAPRAAPVKTPDTRTARPAVVPVPVTRTTPAPKLLPVALRGGLPTGVRGLLGAGSVRVKGPLTGAEQWTVDMARRAPPTTRPQTAKFVEVPVRASKTPRAKPARMTPKERAAARSLGHSKPYPCTDPALGKVLLGRRGGAITACLTPTRRKPSVWQYEVGAHNVPKAAVKARLFRQDGRACLRGREALEVELLPPSAYRFRGGMDPFTAGRRVTWAPDLLQAHGGPHPAMEGTVVGTTRGPRAEIRWDGTRGVALPHKEDLVLVRASRTTR